MRFKSFTKKYSFPQDVLIKNFPDYMQKPIANLLFDILHKVNVLDSNRIYHTYFLTNEFIDDLQIHFREVFPRDWGDALIFIFSNPSRTADFLVLCLQNYADGFDAGRLEYILSTGGSAYEVSLINKDASEYDKGVYDLIDRVSPIVKEQSTKALNANDLLYEAWNSCYSRNPDYEKVVSRCCDFLESYLGKLYFPKDPKPQLKKFIHAFEQTPSVLNYKGDTIVNPKSNLTTLLIQASNIRGQHTGGQGRVPIKEEAEFVLHTTIYIWNLHQK